MQITEHSKRVGQALPAVSNFIEMMGVHEGKRVHFFAAVWVDGVVQHVQNTPNEGVEMVLRQHLKNLANGSVKKGPAA